LSREAHAERETMTEIPIHSGDDVPRTGGRTVALLTLVGAVLVFYLAFTEFTGPVGNPGPEIAGGVLIALLLARILWRWTQWSRQAGPRSRGVLRSLHTLVDAVGAFVIFRLVYFDPLPRPFGLILVLSIFPLVLGAMTWSVAKCEDEVQRSSAFEGFTWGALVGLGLIHASIIAVRFWPAMSDWLQGAALHATNGLSPAAVGFALGSLFSMMAVWTSLIASWGLWWVAKR
jgi:hypothetical protein